MRIVQYRKYKEVYQVDLEILKKFLKQCDNSINFINKLFTHILIYD